MKWLKKIGAKTGSALALIRGKLSSLRSNASAQPAATQGGITIRGDVYRIALALYGIQIIIGVVLCVAFWSTSYKFAGLRFDVGQLIAVFLAYQAWKSYGEKKIDQLVGVTFLAIPVMDAQQNGPFIAPWPYCRVVRASRRQLQREFPSDDPEKVFKGDDKDPLPEGMVRPIRPTTGSAKKKSDNPLDRALTVTVSYFAALHVSNVFDFAQKFPSAKIEDAEEEMWRQLRDTGDKAVGAVIKARTPAEIISQWDDVCTELRAILESKTNSWGIDFSDAGFTQMDLSHEMATSLRDRAKAFSDAEATLQRERAQSDALAYRTKVTSLTAERALEIELAGKSLEKANYSLIPGENVLGSLLLNHFNKNGGNNGGPVVSTQQQQPKQPQHGKGHKPKPSGSNP